MADRNDVLRDVFAPLALTTAISSCAGLAAVLRGKGKVTRKELVGAVLSSGVAGTIVGLLLWSRLQADLPLLIGVSSLAGAGGASTLDLLLALLRARVTGAGK